MILSESDTDLVVEVPLGISQGQFVSVQVQRSDSGANTSTSRWCKAPLSDLRDGTVTVPGQAPGVTEALDTAYVPDTPQAQDLDAYATALEYLLFEVLTTKGDLFASDGVAVMQRFAVGAAGLVLTAAPAQPLGLLYAAAPTAGRITHSWSKQIDAANVANGAMVANGLSTDQSVTKGEHAAGLAGNLDSVAVLVQVAAGDTLDQVQVFVNGVSAYDSGTGLALTQGQSHIAALVVAVVAADRVEVRAFKAGTAAIMQLRAKVGVA